MYWKIHLAGSRDIIFVFDCVDQERIDFVKKKFAWFLEQKELKGLPLLNLANKQDLVNAMNVPQVTEEPKLNEIKDRQWEIKGTSCKDVTEVLSGLDWLKKAMG